MINIIRLYIDVNVVTWYMARGSYIVVYMIKIIRICGAGSSRVYGKWYIHPKWCIPVHRINIFLYRFLFFYIFPINGTMTLIRI